MIVFCIRLIEFGAFDKNNVVLRVFAVDIAESVVLGTGCKIAKVDLADEEASVHMAALDSVIYQSQLFPES